MIIENGIIINEKTGEVVGVVYYWERCTCGYSVIDLIIRNARRSSIDKMRLAIVMIASKHYSRRTLHALQCFEMLKHKLDLTKNHVKYRKKSIEWVSREFYDLVIDVFKCAGVPQRVLEEIVEYLDTCR